MGRNVPEEGERARRKRRVLARALAFSLCLAAAPIAPAEPYLVEAVRDFTALGTTVRARGLPIVLLVSRTDCPYCELLIAEIINPMLLSGEYEDKALIRELIYDTPEDVTDFSGSAVAPDTIAARYDAWLTPTVLFLGAEGQELVPRIRGINTVEMYSFYLDRAIDRAGERLRAARSRAAPQ